MEHERHSFRSDMPNIEKTKIILYWVLEKALLRNVDSRLYHIIPLVKSIT